MRQKDQKLNFLKMLLSRNNLLKIKYGAYVINFDEYKSIETYWIVFQVIDDYIQYFDSFRVEKKS